MTLNVREELDKLERFDNPPEPLYDVVLHSYPPNNKLAVIKEIRSLVPGMGLSDAKAISETTLPTTFMEGVTASAAKEAIARLAAVGATAEEE